uniref:Secreted protein n=1 Tax=Nelumbo nucifera TaxID=4432 RepID=A0A822XF43_NELNU|nr:TPA_asm: hypothetical protein HUJ06_020433 [Nelumbo nucifera]
MNPIMGTALDLRLLVFTSCFLLSCSSYDEQGTNNSFTVSAFTYSDIRLKPYDWRYIRGAYCLLFLFSHPSLQSSLCFSSSVVGLYLLGFVQPSFWPLLGCGLNYFCF